MELSSNEKAKIQELIDMAMRREFERGLMEVDSILQLWRTGKMNYKESYYLLYKHITDFNKNIAQRYDTLNPTTHLLTLVSMLVDKTIDERDLVDFSHELKNYLKNVLMSLS